MTKDHDEQGGLPSDAGNGMSERSGHYDESPSGLTDTPVATGLQSGRSKTEEQMDADDSGTTFDAGDATPGS